VVVDPGKLVAHLGIAEAALGTVAVPVAAGAVAAVGDERAVA